MALTVPCPATNPPFLEYASTNMLERRSRQAKTWWLAVPAGVALVVSGVAVGRTSVRPAVINAQTDVESTSEENDRRFSILEGELLRLRAEVAASKREAHVETEDKVAEPEPLSDEPTDPAEAERRVEEARAQFLDDLGDRVDTEQPDSRWRRDTEPVISKLLPQHLGPEVTLGNVSCGATLCRAEVSHPGSPRLSENRLADFMLQRESLGAMQVQLDIREEGATTFYFVREQP